MRRRRLGEPLESRSRGLPLQASARAASIVAALIVGGALASCAERIPNLQTPTRVDGSVGAGPLYAFMMHNDAELVEYFLARGLRPIDRTDAGLGVLHAALMSTGGFGDHEATRERIVRRLLDAGADVNARSNDGLTPLMVARSQPASLIRLLVERGADVNAIGQNGRSVFDIFLLSASQDAIAVLRAAGAKLATELAADSAAAQRNSSANAFQSARPAAFDTSRYGACPDPTRPDLVVVDIFFDPSRPDYVYVEYGNAHGTGDGDFLIKLGANGDFYGGNSYYRFPVPATGRVQRTGGFTIGLIGLSRGDTAEISAEIDWESRVEECNEGNNVFVKTVTLAG